MQANDLGESDHKFMMTVGAALSKSVFFICCTVVLCMWMSSCELDESTIASCEESCDGFGSHMESVTSRECVCAPAASIDQRQDVWVLPKTQ